MRGGIVSFSKLVFIIFVFRFYFGFFEAMGYYSVVLAMILGIFGLIKGIFCICVDLSFFFLS